MVGPCLVAPLVFAALGVDGATTCPTPEAVELRLRSLLRPGAASGKVRLERDGQALHVSLHHAGGELTARRTIEGPHACESLADAAAVIVAAWQSDLGGRTLLAGEGAAADAPGVRQVAPAPPASAGPTWGLAAGGGVSLAGGDPAVAVGMTAAHAPVAGVPWAGRLGLLYEGPRESDLAGGTLRWQRWVLELGPQLGGRTGHFGWDLHLGGALGVTQLEARGLADPRDQRDFGLGVAGGARLALGRSGLRPFVELSARGWPTRIVAYEGSTGGEAALARFEVLLTLGAAVGR